MLKLNNQRLLLVLKAKQQKGKTRFHKCLLIPHWMKTFLLDNSSISRKVNHVSNYRPPCHYNRQETRVVCSHQTRVRPLQPMLLMSITKPRLWEHSIKFQRSQTRCKHVSRVSQFWWGNNKKTKRRYRTDWRISTNSLRKDSKLLNVYWYTR